MPKTFFIPNYMNVTGNATAIQVGAPVIFQRLLKKLTISSVDYEFVVPGSQDLDLAELVTQTVVTAENGTTPTVALAWQGCADPLESYTNITDTTLAAGTTTINVTAASGASIGSGTVAIPALLAKFSSSGSPRVLTAYEWVMITSISTDALTVARGQYGTTAQAFAAGDFLFYSNSWAPVLDSGGNAIQLGTFNHDGATAAAPVVAQQALSAEGLSRFPYPAFRYRQAAPTSGGITHKTHLTGVIR